MIITVTDEKEISDCQTRLGDVLESQLVKQGEYPLGSQAGTGIYNLRYDDKIWWLYHIWREGSEPLHSNVFGFCPLHKNSPNQMILTLNVPL